MAVASFEDLCAGFCELVSIPTPALAEDALGRVAFHVVLRATTVNLVHLPNACPNHVFVLFEFGPVEQDGADSFVDLQALLDANFILLQVNPPVFSRNPATGDVVLQYVCPLFEATAHDLHELIDEGVDLVLWWQGRRSSQEMEMAMAAESMPSHDPRNRSPAITDFA